jgi:integrase
VAGGREVTAIGQLQQYDGHLTVAPPKTPHSERVIALDRTTVAALRRHGGLQQAERAQAPGRYHHSGYVFTGLNGDPLAPDPLSRIFKQLAAEARLPPIRLHDLRHGAAAIAFVGRRGSEGGAGHARALQHRADRRHLHQGSGIATRAAGGRR